MKGHLRPSSDAAALAVLMVELPVLIASLNCQSKLPVSMAVLMVEEEHIPNHEFDQLMIHDNMRLT